MIGAFDDLRIFANNVYIRLIKHRPMKWVESLNKDFEYSGSGLEAIKGERIFTK